MSTPHEEYAKRVKARTWPISITIPPHTLGNRRPVSEPRIFEAPDPSDSADRPDPAQQGDEPVIADESEWLTTSEPSTSSVSTTSSSRPPDLSRHARRCSICTHPDRDAIDADFIRWANPADLSRHFNVGGRSAIYRHAHATGLFARRKREFCRVLESILETIDSATFASAEVLIRAARIYAHLDDEGRWYEPPKTITILHGQIPQPPTPEPGKVLTGTPLQTEIALTP
jgi:hypothetical protein